MTGDWRRLLRSRLMRTGVVAFGILMVAAGIWISRPIPPAVLAPSGALGLTIEDRHGVPLRSTRAADGTDARWVVYERIDLLMVSKLDSTSAAAIYGVVLTALAISSILPSVIAPAYFPLLAAGLKDASGDPRRRPR